MRESGQRAVELNMDSSLDYPDGNFSLPGLSQAIFCVYFVGLFTIVGSSFFRRSAYRRLDEE